MGRVPGLDLVGQAKRLNIGNYKRHLLFCAGPTCCDAPQGQALWDYTKRRLKELGLMDAGVYRSKVGCLRVCQNGPLAVVYPEGTWYADLAST